jgi:chorismate mutase/prephenate dehydratase
MGLDEIRKEIDSVDDALLELLNRRCELALRVGERKRASGNPFYVPEREKELVDRLSKSNPGPLPDRALKAVFREVVSASISLQHPLRVASLGSAARELFGASVDIESKRNIDGIFDAVDKGDCDYGVVPFRGGDGNIVEETRDALARGNLRIIAERCFGDAADIALGKQETRATGRDHTAVLVSAKRPADLADTVARALDLHGMEAIAAAAWTPDPASDSKLLLTEVAGHPSDERVEKFLLTVSETLGPAGKVRIIGGYPVM